MNDFISLAFVAAIVTLWTFLVFYMGVFVGMYRAKEMLAAAEENLNEAKDLLRKVKNAGIHVDGR